MWASLSSFLVWVLDVSRSSCFPAPHAADPTAKLSHPEADTDVGRWFEPHLCPPAAWIPSGSYLISGLPVSPKLRLITAAAWQEAAGIINTRSNHGARREQGRGHLEVTITGVCPGDPGFLGQRGGGGGPRQAGPGHSEAGLSGGPGGLGPPWPALSRLLSLRDHGGWRGVVWGFLQEFQGAGKAFKEH